MGFYRKKPVVIEAIEFKVTRELKCKHGVHQDYNGMEICEFMGLPMLNTRFDKKGAYIDVETLEGTHRADVGDYIIKGVKGEFYPCKPDIFKLTYDEEE